MGTARIKYCKDIGVEGKKKKVNMERSKAGIERVSPDGHIYVSRAFVFRDRYPPKKWMNYLINLTFI